MQLLVVSAVIIASALLAVIRHTARVRQKRARVREQLGPALQSTGLQVSGDLLGAYQLHGNFEGIDLGFEKSAFPPRPPTPRISFSVLRLARHW